MPGSEKTELLNESVEQRLLRTGELSDCTFIVGEKGGQNETFCCHKFPLCMASEVFQAMFLGEMNERGDIKVTDIAPEIFKILLQYVYKNKLQLDDLEISLHVMMAANKYLISTLVDKCVSIVMDKMETVNVCKVFELAILIDHEKLKQACIKMIQEKTEEILNASSWVDTPCAFVITIVQQDTLNLVSELYLIAACERWVRHQVADVRLAETLASLKLNLRVRALNAEQFVEATVEDCIFSEQEFRQILGCIVRPELKLPEGICELTYPRLVPDIDEVDINAIINYMSNRNSISLSLAESSAKDTSAFNPLVLFAVRCHVIIYGVYYSPITYKNIDILNRISNQMYDENMTIQLIDMQTRACVTSQHFQEKITYGSSAKVLTFNHPYLMRDGTQLELRVTYHDTVKGQRSFFQGNTNFLNVVPTDPKLYSKKGTAALGISFLMYKIVT